MSIVLDALEKAERERIRRHDEVSVGGAATLSPPAKLRRRWVVGLGLLVIINVAVLGTFVWFGGVPPFGDEISLRLGEEQKLKVLLVKKSITSHVWSENPSNRFILIDGQLVREGEAMGEAIVLEEIGEDGIRVSYKDRSYRFSIADLWPDLGDIY